MYTIPFKKMIQPRVGATWAYNGQDTIYASYARYNPAASSLPRAASWDRNIPNAQVNVYFDSERRRLRLRVSLIVVRQAVRAGPDAAHDRTSSWSGRRSSSSRASRAGRTSATARARTSGRTRTTTRACASPRRPGIPQELYIPDLSARLAQIGSGSTYVIAELDGAYTKYYEVTARGGVATAARRSSAARTPWSHYWGNFDQDNSTDAGNDANIFIGSSNIGDGAGRQLWNFKDGTLRGDRPHMFKVYGYYQLTWNAQRRRLRHRPVGPAVGERGATSRTSR